LLSYFLACRRQSCLILTQAHDVFGQTGETRSVLAATVVLVPVRNECSKLVESVETCEKQMSGFEFTETVVNG